tara:strand:+ start:78 stop:344 length:267 start_codon:yes stop_codon:yes gene_type:complete
MLEIETKDVVVTKTIYNVKPRLTLEELEKIQTALYETDKESDLLQKIGDVVRDAQSRIKKLETSVERNITQDEVIQAQSGACTTGNCD